MEAESTELRSHVDRACQGDVEAWEWLYRRMYPRLFSYARRRLDGDAVADDAVSETMIRALDKIESFSWRGAGFEGWLFGICRNVLLESYRTHARTVAMDEIVDLADPADNPADQFEESLSRAQLLAAFAKLDPDEQEVLHLRVVAELSAEAVGEVLGKRSGAVRMAQSRALSRLRSNFAEVSRG